MRDQLGLNQGAMGGLEHQQLMVLSEKKRQKALRAQLAEGLGALPEPQYSYEISIPELDEEDAAAEAAATASIPEDAADRDAREAARRRAKEEEELERRSTVLKRGLPRPPTVDPEAFKLPKGADVAGDAVVAADQAVLQELLGVLLHDHAKYPVGKEGNAGGKKGKKSKGAAGGGAVPHLATIHPKLLAKARAMVEEEAGAAGGPPALGEGELEEAWLKAYGDLAYFPNRQAFGRLSGAAKPDRLAALIFQFDALSSALERDAKKAAKVEARLNVATGGYNKRASTLLAGINEALNAIDEMRLEVGCFRRLKGIEDQAVGRRLAKLQAEVRSFFLFFSFFGRGVSM